MTCPVCHIAVAPHDPEKKVRNGQTFHGGCLNPNRGATQQRVVVAVKERQPRQTYFRFPAAAAYVN